VTKSVVSTLVGIALDEGLTGSVDDRLGQLLPGYADVMSPAVARITLRQLHTMTAGFPRGVQAQAPAFTRSADWVRTILTNPESAPGERFLYSNGTSRLLVAVVQEATGMSALEFARSRLFDPLGIDTRPAMRRVATPGRLAEALAAYQESGFSWPRDPQGVSTGWWGLKLLPRDMATLGQLFLAGRALGRPAAGPR
jgi:CubicO group peptidase (beta-lactamase class C family)